MSTLDAVHQGQLVRHHRASARGNGPSNGDADNTRAFGYIDDRAAVSPRVINESARVAEWLSHGIR